MTESRQKKEQNTPLRAVLFDMDGVLYDSMPMHAEAWVQAMHRHGLTMTDEQVYMNEGRTGEGTIDLFTLEQWGREATAEEVEAIYRTKSDIFNELDEAPAMQGANEVLAEVKGKGLLPLIVTGSGQRSLLSRLERSYPGYFNSDLMVTAYDVKRGKPNPEPYLKGLEKAGAALGRGHALKPSEALVVENAPLGVQAGKAAGIRVMAVNTGPLPDDVLREAGADWVLPDMYALLDWFKNTEL